MEYDFSYMTDIELAVMQHDLRKFPEDAHFLEAVLVEIGNRQDKKYNKKLHVDQKSGADSDK